jgi:CPA2 family monovalent cation:H+ antiporter-2
VNHLPNLIRDLGLILIVAGITTLLFRQLKQPVVLGYIIAGMLVSPNLPLLPSISDIEDIRIWAEIGVVFLLFTLGLEFSFKKLVKIGGAASITALVELSAMLVIGFLLGYFMGWPTMDCIFLGGILSIASTTIILRTYDELGVKSKRFAQLVFGVLIVEDLIAVILLVLLSTIAVSRQFAGTEMLGSVLKLSFFLLLWFTAGIFFIPSFLSRVQKHLSDETLLIVSLGLCLAMAILASVAGFSPALGAFMMGSIMAETTQAERIEYIIKPVKDLFGAVFFVSVGMLLDPKILADYAVPVLIITVVFVTFKSLHVAIGALIAGQPLKTSIYAGMSMAQIGEFSFIIATLGLTLGVTSSFLYPIAVAVSAVTTFTTPYMIKMAGPVYNKLEKVLPLKWKNRYSAGAQSIASASDWQKLLRAYFTQLIFFSVIIAGIIVLFANYLRPWIYDHIADGFRGSLITAVSCLLVLSPFLWALMMRKLHQEAVAGLWSNRRFRGPLIFLRLVRVVLGIVYIAFFLVSILPFDVAVVGVIILVMLSIIFSARIHSFYIKLENRFFANYHSREVHQAKVNRHELAPWDAHIVQYKLPANSAIAGKTLEEIAVREQFGVNIALIRRGENYIIHTPPRNEKVYPGDRLLVIGTDEQLELFGRFIQPLPGTMPEIEGTPEIVLKKIEVKESSFMDGKTIRDSGVREKTNGLVVGIERRGRRLLNPESYTIFEKGDKVWIVGDPRLIAIAMLE